MPNTLADLARAPAPILPQHEDAIRTQIVRDLYSRSRTALVTLLALTVVIRWAIDPAYTRDAGVRYAFYALVAVTVARFALTMVPEARREASLSRGQQYALFVSGIALSACSLAAIVVLSWPLLDPTRIAILAVITSGLVSGAVMSVGFSPLVYGLYMLPPVGALFVMAVYDTRPPWGADILATAFVIYAAAVVAISLDQRRTRRRAIALSLQLSDMVVRDSLTRLHNRRFLQEIMSVEAARISRDAKDLQEGREPRRATALGIFIMDVDEFKHVNDTYGHAAGDAVLMQTGDALCRALRKSDILVRWGGEEFVAVVRVSEPADVRLVAEKLRRAVEATEFLLQDDTRIRKTISVGYAAMPFHHVMARRLSWEEVLSLADAALYVAKAEGRNRSVGVLPGTQAWGNDNFNIASVVQDLRGAERSGLVALERVANP